jgi:DNA polymerase-4
MPAWERCILHADLDAFFASVEQLDDPSIRGQPVLVGGSGGRGVVAAASYEARVFGCRSAMPVTQALRLCPQAVVRPARFDRYAQLSRAFMEILLDQDPLVEAISVDEAFVDVTGSQRRLGSGQDIATVIRRRTRETLGLGVSVGVAPCRFVAKIASDMHKPDGLTVIEPDRVVPTLAPLPIERMWGVGPRTAPRLHAMGVHTFHDLQRRGEAEIRSMLGESGVAWRLLALGVDDRPVVPAREALSVGHEETFDTDLADPDALRAVLQEQCERVAMRLRAHGGVTRCVSLKLRTPDFVTRSRQVTLTHTTDATLRIWREAEGLLETWLRQHPGPLRLIGISVSVDAAGGEPPTLFTDPLECRQRAVDAVADAATARFGPGALRRAGARQDGHRTRRDLRPEGPRPEAG